MELNHELKIMKALFYILVLLFFYSCGEADCNQVKKAYYPDEYYIFVTQSKVDLTWIKLEGYVPETSKRSSVMVHNNWGIGEDEIDYGDVILKRKGALPLTIHKKDTIITHDWYCRGKPYQ